MNISSKKYLTKFYLKSFSDLQVQLQNSSEFSEIEHFKKISKNQLNHL